MKEKVIARRYQGKEETSILQANSMKDLNALIRSSKEFAKKNDLVNFRVLGKGKDPDGGYRAVVTAHNWNPIKWVKEKLSRKPRPEAEPKPEPITEAEYREVPGEGTISGSEGEAENQKFKEDEAKRRAEDEFTRQRAANEAAERMEYERLRAQRKVEEEELARKIGKLPPKERKRYEKRAGESFKTQAEAAFELWEGNIPKKKKKLVHQWNDQTKQWEWREIEVTLSPQERLAEARIQKLGGVMIEEEIAEAKQRKRERSTPYRISKAIGGFGQEMAAVSMLGVAGTAQAILPRGKPSKARGLVPSLPIEAYRVGTPNVDLSGLRRPLQPMFSTGGAGGLEHLKGAMLPKIRKPQFRRIPLTSRPGSTATRTS